VTTVEDIPAKARVCWNCWLCMKWTAYPGKWVGCCMNKDATDFGAYIWLERDTCAYFVAAQGERQKGER
jgi:hypothetical protein